MRAVAEMERKAACPAGHGRNEFGGAWGGRWQGAELVGARKSRRGVTRLSNVVRNATTAAHPESRSILDWICSWDCGLCFTLQLTRQLFAGGKPKPLSKRDIWPRCCHQGGILTEATGA